MASSSTPSSSITTLPKKHEVFLSFRGEDTRYGFTSHLYEALCRKQIETFIDDDKLERGDEISLALLRAIEGSKIAVVIFSENYASSKWCLRELAEIIKCKKMNKLIVMPVFYNVDPSDVRKQTGSFECSFANYKEKELQEEVQKWREVLTEASNLSGWDSSVIRTESKLVCDVVEGVWRKLRSEYIPSSSDFKGLVGIHKRIERVMSLLCLDMEDVRIIGIWGMGGIGKTTIAQVVFKFISYKFDGACFIENVGKILENGGSNHLLLEVLSKVLHEENLKLGTPTICPFIMKKLNQKKVFIVLDDVNNFLQLETLVERLNRYGSGSRIIITSRDKQVLCNFNVDGHEIYEAEGFNDDEAIELFCKYANPTEDCMGLLDVIVDYVKGNPLVLKVLGSSLKGKSKQEWKSALDDLQGTINSEIFDVLKISYDGLEEKEKNLFLDLACFKDLFYNHGLLKEDHEYSLSVLVAKSLITMETYENEVHEWKMGTKIEMHDLLQEMGREIVRRESPKILGKRSRLWKRDDVIRTLKNNAGTDAVEAISLLGNLEDIHLSSQVFDKMHNLRMIIFNTTYLSNKVYHPNRLNCLPDELMILHWYGYPLRALPSNFNPKKLVNLDLSRSNIEQLWEGTKHAPKLKWLNLSYCPHLTKIPNLSDFPLLLEVNLRDCKRLVDFPSSVQQLNNLRNLHLSGTAIEEVPSSIQSLTGLTKLDLSNCKWLKHISTRICNLTSLKYLHLPNHSKLDKLPDNLGNLKSLKWLEVSGYAFITCLENLVLPACGYRGLTRLPPLSGLQSLQTLTLHSYNCSLMEIPEDIGCLSSLKKLELCGFMFESLPKSIKQLSKLEFLSLSHCKMLRSLPVFPEGLKRLEAMHCENLIQVPDASEFVRCINYKSHRSVPFIFTDSLNLKAAISNVFEESLRIMQRTEKGSGKPSNQFSIYLRGNEIPEWFSYQRCKSSVNIQVLRNDLVNRKFMGFAVCAFLRFEEYYSRGEQYMPGVFCEFEIYHDHIKIGSDSRDYHTDKVTGHRVFKDLNHMLLGYISFSSFYSSFQNPKKLSVTGSDYVDISIKFSNNYIGWYRQNWCAVHPIYAEEPSEIIGATIQEIGETSGRRSDRSDDDDEEVEPHPKRICTQTIIHA